MRQGPLVFILKVMVVIHHKKQIVHIKNSMLHIILRKR